MKKSRIWKGCTGDDIYVKKYCIVMALDHKRKAFTDGKTTVMYISISHIYDNFILKTQRNLWLFGFLFLFQIADLSFATDQRMPLHWKYRCSKLSSVQWEKWCPGITVLLIVSCPFAFS